MAHFAKLWLRDRPSINAHGTTTLTLVRVSFNPEQCQQQCIGENQGKGTQSTDLSFVLLSFLLGFGIKKPEIGNALQKEVYSDFVHPVLPDFVQLQSTFDNKRRAFVLCTILCCMVRYSAIKKPTNANNNKMSKTRKGERERTKRMGREGSTEHILCRAHEAVTGLTLGLLRMALFEGWLPHPSQPAAAIGPAAISLRRSHPKSRRCNHQTRMATPWWHH
jgi:hypothetical protein